MVFRTDEVTSGYSLTQGMDNTGVYFKTNSTGRGFRWIRDTTEDMRIDSAGRVLVGSSSAGFYAARQHIQGGECLDITNTAASGVGIGIAIRRTDGSGGEAMRFISNTSIVGFINTTGTNTSYLTSSDYRLKEDWQPIENSIDRFMQLKPCNFAWKIDGTRVDGFLAHEAQEVVPESVTGTKDAVRTEEYEVEPAVYDEEGNAITEAVIGEREVPDYQGIDQSKLVPLITAALQDAIKKIEALEERIEALES
jgi:hypothetical protein